LSPNRSEGRAAGEEPEGSKGRQARPKKAAGKSASKKDTTGSRKKRMPAQTSRANATTKSGSARSRSSASANGSPKKSKRRASRSRAASSGAVSSIDQAVEALPSSDLSELYRFWSGDPNVTVPDDAGVVRRTVLEWIEEGDRLFSRVAGLGRRLSTLLDIHLSAPRYELTVAELAADKRLAYLSRYDLEAGLAVLRRRALLTSASSSHVRSHGREAHRVPDDLGDSILRQRRSARRGIFDTFTLRGHLDRLYDDPSRAVRTPKGRVRELYKMYANENAAVARLGRLPEGLRALIEKVTLEFGGFLPRGLFDRMESELPHWNGRRWGKILEESLIGTCQRLELGRYGIQHADDTLIVFNEITLAWLRRVAVPGDPDAPHDEASLGVDLVSNIGRFLSFIIDHNVRFTVRGEIFKTTEKRILQDLIPNPGRELERSEVLGFIYHFARHTRLIESTGERTFSLTTAGRDWEPQKLDAKVGALVDYIVEERGLGGEPYHQARMRRIFLRLLKRIEPGIWYDIMYLPFLARNNYLCSLDELAVDEYFEARTQTGQYSPVEDLQRLSWNLVSWVRKRLYLLGLVDLGYDKAGRPVAMRLTRIGARLLGLVETEEDLSGIGNLVVTPDFEVVLFPTGDDAELTHDLDRFCERGVQGHLRHFRITDQSVHRALTEGLGVAVMQETLESNARTPVPQNVLFSIRDWAARAGLVSLSKSLIAHASDPELMARFATDPGVKPYVSGVIDETHVQLKKRMSASRMRTALRDLDYLVELED